ncbi:MAG: hypothetical protein WD766_09520 [Gemmatimonadota bacterium]
MLIALALFGALAVPGAAAAQQAAVPQPADSAQAAQRDELVGSVVLDGQPIPDIPVTLHRVTPQESGEIASGITDEQGRFRFSLESGAPTGFTIFFVTADYLSARYFGQPIHTDDPVEGEYTVAVYDTTSVPSNPVRVVSRDIVLIPEAPGSWEVNEVVRIINPGSRALVSADGLPTWQLTIPERAGEFQVGEGDILPHEVSLMENEVLLLTPVTPGERDLFIRYRLPATPGNAVFPLQEPTESFSLFVLQPSHLTSVEGLATTRMVEAEGEQFLQYFGESFQPGAEIRLEWSSAPGALVDPVIAAVAVTLLLLGVGVWGALRKRPALGM